MMMILFNKNRPSQGSILMQAGQVAWSFPTEHSVFVKHVLVSEFHVRIREGTLKSEKPGTYMNLPGGKNPRILSNKVSQLCICSY